MAELTFYTVLAKWLKKAKLRDGSRSVGLTGDGTFYYRGFPLGFVREDRVILKYPASLKKPGNMWGPEEELLIADPKFFQKLRKSFRDAMTIINGVSINTSVGVARAKLSRPRTKP